MNQQTIDQIQDGILDHPVFRDVVMPVSARCIEQVDGDMTRLVTRQVLIPVDCMVGVRGTVQRGME